MEVIRDSVVYAGESESGHLPGLYYLVSWKKYPKKMNTWELISAIQHLRKLISSFHKDYADKPITTSPPMAWSTVNLLVKQKWWQPTEYAKKRAKWDDKKEAIRRNLSQCNSRDRSRQVAGHLFPWHRERRGAGNGSLIIGSLTPEELYSTLFWPTPLSSKSLLKQTPLFFINLFFPFF